MPIVTLSTDFGTRDHYAAALKGTLLQVVPDLNIVDISHNVNHFDIVQAAFIFKNAWPAFPAGTIHLITVNDLSITSLRYLLLKQYDQYFICPDNGILGLIFSSPKGTIYRLPSSDKNGKVPKKVFANAIQKLSRGVALDQIGDPVDEVVERLTFQPVLTNDIIRGNVIYIDNYKNAISNIDQDLFDKVSKNRPFEILLKGHPPITKIEEHYGQVEVGEPMALFNPQGFLEIAVNMGKAATLLGIQLEDMIQIEFLST